MIDKNTEVWFETLNPLNVETVIVGCDVATCEDVSLLQIFYPMPDSHQPRELMTITRAERWREPILLHNGIGSLYELLNRDRYDAMIKARIAARISCMKRYFENKEITTWEYIT